jgi:electron transfer flavoprotein alpha subunit
VTEKILVVAETSGGTLRDISYELVTAARTMAETAGMTTAMAVIAPEAERLTASVEGVDEVLIVPAGIEHFEAHVWQRAVEALIELERPSLVLIGHTIDALGFAPAVAARLGIGFASDVQAIWWDGGLRAERGTYGGKLTAELGFPGKQCVLLMVREGVFVSSPSRRAPTLTRQITLDLVGAARTERLDFPPTARHDLPHAPFVISIGRGVNKRDAVARLQALADRWGAALTCTRPLVDLGWMPPSRLVGQSAQTVSPRTYLAFGISGAPPHMAGVRGADTIIAINIDPDAPIFSLAKYGAIVDLFEVLAELEEALGLTKPEECR